MRAFQSLCDFAHDPSTGLKHIRINHDAIVALAKTFAGKEPSAPNWRQPAEIFPENDFVYANHEFYRNAINACYADPANPDAKFGIAAKKLSGSMAMGHCFWRKFGERPVSPDDILELTDTPGVLEEFFRADVPIPLLEKRRQNLRQCAVVLEKYFDGDPLNILEQSRYRVLLDPQEGNAGIVDHLFEYFPDAFGQDYAVWKDHVLTFAKRAQLWPCLYQGRALEPGSKLQPLADPENIGPILDYHVVNVLRYHGCLEYSPELAAKVDSRTPIARHSPEEIEMRAKAGAVIVKLVELINAMRPAGVRQWTGVEIDAALWLFGREAAKKHPYHLCLTMDY